MPRYSPELDPSPVARGYWFITHKLAIAKWSQVALYIVIALSYLLFFVQFAVYLYRYNDWGNLVARSIRPSYDWTAIHAQKAPLSLVVGTPTVFPRSDNRYDIVVDVYNPNAQWAVKSVAYTFGINGGVTFPAKTGFVLPQEHTFFSFLNAPTDTPIHEVGVALAPPVWQRMITQPAQSWIFTEQPQFVGKQVVIDHNTQKIVPARITWTVRNGSTLNFRGVTWLVAVYRGNNLISYYEYQSGKFPFFDEQPFELFVYDALSQVDSVKVIPVVNIFDSSFTYQPSS